MWQLHCAALHCVGVALCMSHIVQQLRCAGVVVCRIYSVGGHHVGGSHCGGCSVGRLRCERVLSGKVAVWIAVLGNCSVRELRQGGDVAGGSYLCGSCVCESFGMD